MITYIYIYIHIHIYIYLVTGTPVIYLYVLTKHQTYIKLFRYGAYIWSIPNMNFAHSYIANISKMLISHHMDLWQHFIKLVRCWVDMRSIMRWAWAFDQFLKWFSLKLLSGFHDDKQENVLKTWKISVFSAMTDWVSFQATSFHTLGVSEELIS